MSSFAVFYDVQISALACTAVSVEVSRNDTGDASSTLIAAPTDTGGWVDIDVAPQFRNTPVQFRVACDRGEAVGKAYSPYSPPVMSYFYNRFLGADESPQCFGHQRDWSNPQCWTLQHLPNEIEVVVLNHTDVTSEVSFSVAGLVCAGNCTIRVDAGRGISTRVGAYSDARHLEHVLPPAGAREASSWGSAGPGILAIYQSPAGDITKLDVADPRVPPITGNDLPPVAPPFPLAGIVSSSVQGAQVLVFSTLGHWTTAIAEVFEVSGRSELRGIIRGPGTLRTNSFDPQGCDITAGVLVTAPSFLSPGSLPASALWVLFDMFDTFEYGVLRVVGTREYPVEVKITSVMFKAERLDAKFATVMVGSDPWRAASEIQLRSLHLRESEIIIQQKLEGFTMRVTVETHIDNGVAISAPHGETANILIQFFNILEFTGSTCCVPRPAQRVMF